MKLKVFLLFAVPYVLLTTPAFRAAGAGRRLGPLSSRMLTHGLAAIMALSLVNCQITVDPRKPNLRGDLHSQDDLAVNLQQIRLRMRSLVDPMCGQVEAAADEIIASTADPSVKRAAVEWKAEAIPALREALYEPGPLRALFDSWVFSNQMAVFYSTGPGASRLGDRGPIAVRTSLDMERQLRDVAASFTKSGDVTRARAAARNWAVAHPITTRIAHRETTLSQAGENADAGALTATETLSDMTMTVDDLNRKIEVYTDQLLRQVRWEAELITMDLSNQLGLDQAMPLASQAVNSVGEITESVDEVAGTVDVAVTTLVDAMPLLERVVAVIEQAPTLISSERAAAIIAVQEELTRTIQFVREEREVALQHVTAERLAALQTLQDSIVEERKIVTEDARGISRDAIDHAIWRTGQLIAIVIVIALITLLAGLFLVRSMVAGLLRQHLAEMRS